MRQILTYISLLLFCVALLSCDTQDDNQNNSNNQKANLIVKDETGKFEGRQVQFEITKTYLSGEINEMRFYIDDTMLVHTINKSGIITKKQTFVNEKLIDEIIIEVEDWGKSQLYKVSSIIATKKVDTLEITVDDNSYIWFDEYVKWKSDYVIKLNYEKIGQIENVKTKFIQTGKEIKHEFYYSQNDIISLLNNYSLNQVFDSISSIVLGSFEPADIMNLRNANNYLNETLKDYNGDIVQLFSDFSLCQDSCKAENRLRFIGEMFKEIKLDDFWSEDKIDSDGFIERLNLIFALKNKEKI
jgi:hypothetical protein